MYVNSLGLKPVVIMVNDRDDSIRAQNILFEFGFGYSSGTGSLSSVVELDLDILAIVAAPSGRLSLWIRNEDEYLLSDFDGERCTTHDLDLLDTEVVKNHVFNSIAIAKRNASAKRLFSEIVLPKELSEDQVRLIGQLYASTNG